MRKGEDFIGKMPVGPHSNLRREIIAAIESAQREAWNEAVAAAVEIAFKKSAMLANDSDLTRGYANGRQDAAEDIRSLHREEGR